MGRVPVLIAVLAAVTLGAPVAALSVLGADEVTVPELAVETAPMVLTLDGD